MRQAARPSRRQAVCLSLQEGSENLWQGDRSLAIRCIRILTFKIAIRNHFSTHCSFRADELHFQTEKQKLSYYTCQEQQRALQPGQMATEHWPGPGQPSEESLRTHLGGCNFNVGDCRGYRVQKVVEGWCNFMAKLL